MLSLVFYRSWSTAFWCLSLPSLKVSKPQFLQFLNFRSRPFLLEGLTFSLPFNSFCCRLLVLQSTWVFYQHFPICCCKFQFRFLMPHFDLPFVIAYLCSRCFLLIYHFGFLLSQTIITIVMQFEAFVWYLSWSCVTSAMVVSQIAFNLISEIINKYNTFR